MIYASKTPRDLNHDPEPWIGRSPVTGDLIHTPVKPSGMDGFHVQPRDDYDHEQYNEPNPILVAFRADGDPGDPADWLDYSESAYIGPPEHLDHARKVLARLVALSKPRGRRREAHV
jgi:hypothetical protein